MPKYVRTCAMLSIAIACACSRAADFASKSDEVKPNDNRQSSGVLKDGVLHVALEARTGIWHPEGAGGGSLTLAAFAEPGQSMSTPGPVIRVPVGTEVRASVRNTLDKPLIVLGFGKTRGISDSAIVPVGGTSELNFTATTPGTYYYIARRTPDANANSDLQDSQLHGFIIVDSLNAPPAAHERLIAISWANTLDKKSRTGLGIATMTMNGLSWPHTERLDYAEGDSVHWRVVNFTDIDHPMHLHGFYFRVESNGNGVQDTLLTAAQQRMAVTEVIAPLHTESFSWYADRPGNWIYHCHYASHLSTATALDNKHGVMDTALMSHHMTDKPHQMYGLVMGISITPKNAAATTKSNNEPTRDIRIVQRNRAGNDSTPPVMSFVMDGTPDASDANAFPVPGPLMVLERGKRVAVKIVNASNDHASVHWHGVELESYPDGVPGWSGSGKNILPSIAPNDSLTVRWTPKRAGSFMYHSHFNEATQMGSGLYGPIVVLEPGEHFDAATDKILFFGTAGAGVNVIDGPFPHYIMNGKEQPAPMDLQVGTRYRFRLFNLAGDSPTFVTLNAGSNPVTWRAVAKDGYPLPASQATSRLATLMFDPGEIYDFEYTPTAKGELSLTFGPPPTPPTPPPVPGAKPEPPKATNAPPPPPDPTPPTVKVAVRIH